MSEATVYIVGAVCLLVGWYANEAWDMFMDWLFEMTGAARSALWDLMAILGIIAVCVLGAWIWLR